MIMLTAEHSHFSDCTLFYDMLYYNLLTCFNVLKFNLRMLNYNLGPRPINSMFLLILQGSIIIMIMLNILISQIILYFMTYYIVIC